MKILFILLLIILEAGIVALFAYNLKKFKKEADEEYEDEIDYERNYYYYKLDEILRHYEDIHCERCRYFNTEMCDKCQDCLFYSPRRYMIDPKPPAVIYYIVS